MKTNAPKFTTWVIAVVIGVLGLLGFVAKIPFVSPYAFWFAFVGFVILAVATAVQGL